MSGTVEIGDANVAEVTDDDLKTFADTGKPEVAEKEPKPVVADAGREDDDAPETETEDEKAERISASRVRRERQKAAKERDQREKADLRREVAELRQAVLQSQSASVETKVAALESRFEQVKQVFQRAEYDIANGATGQALVEALARRDSAREEAARIIDERKALPAAPAPQQRQQAAPQQRPVSPEMRRHAESFMEKVPFIQSEPDSDDAELVKTIDAELTRDGWNPNLPSYWEELYDRVKDSAPHRFTEKKRSGPNLSGSSRSGGAPSAPTNPLTPARIAAMKQAGTWDDPKARERGIAYYRDYDKNNSAR